MWHVNVDGLWYPTINYDIDNHVPPVLCALSERRCYHPKIEYGFPEEFFSINIITNKKEDYEFN
jgi:hypothetical protein